MAKKRGLNLTTIDSNLSAQHIAVLEDLSPGLGMLLSRKFAEIGNAHAASNGLKGTVQFAEQDQKDHRGKRFPAIALSEMRGADCADPVDPLDIVNLRTLRRYSNDAYARAVEATRQSVPRPTSSAKPACATPQLVVAGSISVSSGSELIDFQTLAVRGDYLYIVGRDENLGSPSFNHVRFHVYFIRYPAAIKRVADLDLGLGNSGGVGGPPYWIEVRGRFAYVVSNGGTTILSIVDITRADNPVYISATNLGIPNGGLGITVEGRSAYISCFNAGVNACALTDISDPAVPRVIGFANGQIIGSTGFGNQAIIKGDRLYFCDPSVLSGATQGFLDIFNVANPAAPFLEGFVQLTTHRPSGVWVDGEFAYVVGDTANDLGSAMSVINILNPATPTIVSTLPITSHGGALCGGGITGQGDHVFISGEPSPLIDVDVSVRTSPTIIATGQDQPAPFVQTLQPSVQARYVWTMEQRLGTPILPFNLVAYNIGGFRCEEVDTDGIQVSGHGEFQTVRSKQGDFSEAVTCGDILVANGFPVVIAAGAPTTNDIPSGRFRVWQNLGSGELRLIANYNGVLKSVLLT